MSVVDRFMAVFEGSDLAHGQTTIGNVRRSGKMDAKSFIVKEPLTADLVSKHISGKQGVGTIPINSNNLCKFGVLDIDTYPIEHDKIVQKCRKHNLPFVVCRSKSGGAHLYLFMKEWTPASEIRDYLGEFASALGYAGCEIFPKQDQILVERGDVGNFINLPYFDAENTVRYAVDENGDDLTLEEFLELAESSRTSPAELEKIDFGTARDIFTDAPPCIQVLMSMGIPEGMRNKTMFSVGLYCKRKWPDDWEKHLEEINFKHCSPPLPASEITTIQKQLMKKEYFYTCKEEPFASHCNKGVCKNRKFGVGNDDSAPVIGGLTILLSEPRLYFLDVDGKRVELMTEQLQMPLQFQRQCMEQINYMPPLMKPSEWQQLVNAMLESATTIDVSEELTVKGQFKELLEIYCTSRIRARSPEEITIGKPWTEDGLTYFTMKGLQEFLKQRGFTNFNRPQIQERLKEMNDGEPATKHYAIRRDDGSRSTIRVWHVPEFETEEIEIPKEERSNDVPF